MKKNQLKELMIIFNYHRINDEKLINDIIGYIDNLCKRQVENIWRQCEKEYKDKVKALK